MAHIPSYIRNHTKSPCRADETDGCECTYLLLTPALPIRSITPITITVPGSITSISPYKNPVLIAIPGLQMEIDLEQETHRG
ncbi:hypothetical protein GYMLUDRAFT_45323 [Collybiopsis luxurians FD-317 M1]|uniref:Uncharacterized protein n=1 Tax=Collybiopsis luxurians FD-317 M1 TaxID=944289 RepID=A0A0D0CJE5_9AGAR|nr:hypothetical protein GYMLUDRAFT_45323 [Collybiopsis luxurians FD-317 M1]